LNELPNARSLSRIRYFGALSHGKVVTAALLVIGGKILSGRTKDQNIVYIAEYLTALAHSGPYGHRIFIA
jgi:hypothetical protein